MLSGNCEQLAQNTVCRLPTAECSFKAERLGNNLDPKKLSAAHFFTAASGRGVCVCLCMSPETTKDRIVCDLYTLSFDERYNTNSRDADCRQRRRRRRRLQRRCLVAHFIYIFSSFIYMGSWRIATRQSGRRQRRLAAMKP